ncbi:MAG: hypothetical protein KKF30_07395, partial [Proteobacteria bacterium]|nr:hypothetical protein [Pseudomonadota bacterium]
MALPSLARANHNGRIEQASSTISGLLNGLVGAFALDEESGSISKDRSWSMADLTISNSVWNGPSVEFNAGNSRIAISKGIN